MSIGQHVKDTTLSAGRPPVGTIVEKKKGDWIYWTLATLSLYWVIASVYAPWLLPEWASKLFWAWVSAWS